MANQICQRCLRRVDTKTPHLTFSPIRHASSKPASDSNVDIPATTSHDKLHTRKNNDSSSPPEKGAMSRRLEQVTEDALLSGRGGIRAVREGSFSPDLKAQLLQKFAGAKFTSENAAALSTATLSKAAGEGTRTTATGRPWTGEEEKCDTVLRMLDDANKPLSPALRGKPTIPTPSVVDLRPISRSSATPGQRIANAKDRVEAYASLDVKGKSDKGLTETDREALKRELRERFTPGYRSMPNSVSGMAELANQRIEDAISRGQFKNIPRGKGTERDTRADNPFIDTTEYIMNKMIQRQGLVPPWIDKQEEVVREARIFRTRLRSDWKRHATRMISSRGGTLEEKLSRARAYAKAEARSNPKRTNIHQDSASDTASSTAADEPNTHDVDRASSRGEASSQQIPSDVGLNASVVGPFRDSDWEKRQKLYVELAIDKLNALTRSYNLLAPDLAKKPYFSLERELKACYADVAPGIADAILEGTTSTNPKGIFATGSLFGGKSSVSAGDSTVKGNGVGDDGHGDGKQAPKSMLARLWCDLWKPPTNS